MILYGLKHSPFVARARIALEAKGLEYDLTPPPGGSTRSAEYLTINPIGKIPTLVTEDGHTVAESETIIDYLEDRFPSPTLLPEDRVARVRMRNAIRSMELYAVPAMFRLFKQMDPATRDDETVQSELAQMEHGLKLVERFTDNAQFAAGGVLSKGDCMLLPSLQLTTGTAGMFGADDPVERCPILAGYRDKARRNEVLGRIWDETAQALAALAG